MRMTYTGYTAADPLVVAGPLVVETTKPPMDESSPSVVAPRDLYGATTDGLQRGPNRRQPAPVQRTIDGLSPAAEFNPGGAFVAPAEPTPIQEAKVQRDIMTADPSTLTDTEHAEVCAAWDAALERALASGVKPAPINPATIIATGQFADRPQLRRELTRTHVRLGNGRLLKEIPAPAGGWGWSDADPWQPTKES